LTKKNSKHHWRSRQNQESYFKKSKTLGFRSRSTFKLIEIDTKYRVLLKQPGKKNILMLHAYKINFSIAEKKYSYTADPPLVFKNILKEKYLKIYL